VSIAWWCVGGEHLVRMVRRRSRAPGHHLRPSHSYEASDPESDTPTVADAKGRSPASTRTASAASLSAAHEARQWAGSSTLYDQRPRVWDILDDQEALAPNGGEERVLSPKVDVAKNRASPPPLTPPPVRRTPRPDRSRHRSGPSRLRRASP